MKFLDALQNASKRLSAEFEDTKLFEHSGEKGEIREQIISQLLRPFLPEAFGLGTGQIFSINGEISNQIDIAIYDALYSNVLFKDKSSSLYPAESIYGEIEIKSMLSTDELLTSLDNIASVKKLYRSKSTILDITPITHINLGKGLSAGTGKLNPYVGIIFAYDSLKPETIVEKMNDEAKKRNKNELPDFIFCFQKKYMVFQTKNNAVVPLGNDFENYAYIETGEDTISMMFLTLNTCLNTIQLKAPDYNKYWMNLFNQVQKNN